MRVGWDRYGDRVMEEAGGLPGTRPWGWWRFEAGEYPPKPDEDDYVTQHDELEGRRRDHLLSRRR